MISYNLTRDKISIDKEFCLFNTKKLVNTFVVGISIENSRTWIINDLLAVIKKSTPVLVLQVKKKNKIYFIIYYQTENLYIDKAKKHSIIAKKYYMYLHTIYSEFLKDSRSNNILSLESTNFRTKQHKNPYWCIANGYTVYLNNLDHTLKINYLARILQDISLITFDNNFINGNKKNIAFNSIKNIAVEMTKKGFYTYEQLLVYGKSHIHEFNKLLGENNYNEKNIIKIVDDINNWIDIDYFKNPEIKKKYNDIYYKKKRAADNRATNKNAAIKRGKKQSNKNYNSILKSAKKLKTKNIKVTAQNLSDNCTLSLRTVKKYLKDIKSSL